MIEYNTPAIGQSNIQTPSPMRKHISIAVVITLAAVGFRLFLAGRLAADEDGDGKFYALIARNIIEHHVYSGNEEEPYRPTLARAPGYPLMLAGIYKIFGGGNDRAVRLIQILLDTVTCWLIALLAAAWAPLEWAREKRRRSNICRSLRC